MKNKSLILKLLIIILAPMLFTACGETIGGDPGILFDEIFGMKEAEFNDPYTNQNQEPEPSDADFETEVTVPENLIAYEDMRGIGWRVKSDPVKILYEWRIIEGSCGGNAGGGYGSAIIDAGKTTVNPGVFGSNVHPLAVSGAYSYKCPGRWMLGVCASYKHRYYEDAKAEQEITGTNNCDYKEFEIKASDLPNDAPVMDFSYTCDGLTCNFDGNDSYDDMAIFHRGWRFNAPGTRAAGQSGYTMNETYTFDEPGTHEVCLWGSDQYRLYTIECKDVTVTE
jgi:hypothetical protein